MDIKTDAQGICEKNVKITLPLFSSSFSFLHDQILVLVQLNLLMIAMRVHSGRKFVHDSSDVPLWMMDVSHICVYAYMSKSIVFYMKGDLCIIS